MKTGIDAATSSTFFTRRNTFAFSAYLAGWGADSGEMSNSLNSLLLCFDPESGRGFTNRGRYCNREVDRLTVAAMRTFDGTRATPCCAKPRRWRWRITR